MHTYTQWSSKKSNKSALDKWEDLKNEVKKGSYVCWAGHVCVLRGPGLYLLAGYDVYASYDVYTRYDVYASYDVYACYDVYAT